MSIMAQQAASRSKGAVCLDTSLNQIIQDILMEQADHCGAFWQWRAPENLKYSGASLNERTV